MIDCLMELCNICNYLCVEYFTRSLRKDSRKFVIFVNISDLCYFVILWFYLKNVFQLVFLYAFTNRNPNDNLLIFSYTQLFEVSYYTLSKNSKFPRHKIFMYIFFNFALFFER